MSARGRLIVFVLSFALSDAVADEVLYRYEGDVLPYDPSAGWVIADPCEQWCDEYLEDGHFVLHWAEWGDLANYHYWIAQPPAPPPPSLWVEWRYRSNHPLGPYFYTCDGRFSLHYAGMHEVVFMFGDAAISFSSGDAVTGLDINQFHTYRFESLDGVDYWISADGEVFILDGENNPNGYHYLQFSGQGGCDPDLLPTFNEWDFVRFGTISYGEQIVASDPPNGLLDARHHGALDRFTVTFDSPNYVYIDEITIEVTGGVAPSVIQTRRRENDEPDTVEIVLDRPIPMAQQTRFIFNDGVAVNVVEYTFVPGDTDGDGDRDLSDVAWFQNCFDVTEPVGACQALDLNEDQTIDLADWTALSALLLGPTH